MPEGHTVHRLARVFARCFVGRVVAASSPQGRFADGAGVLDGLRMTAAEAQGKHLFLGFAGGPWLRVHLGLYGGWRFAGPGLSGEGGRREARPRRAAGGGAVAGPDDAGAAAGGGDAAAWPAAPRGLVRLRLLAGDRVADLSGPTACVLETAAAKAAAMAKLGEDPLRDDADADAAGRAVRASRSAIGLLLMRQDLVSGIGNIYRAEVLFRAGIDPHRPGRDVTEAEWGALWADLRALMQDGVERGRIVTTRPEHRGSGRRGGAAARGDASYVAHRAGRPCRVCGTAVRSEAMGGRTLYWCGACQAG